MNQNHLKRTLSLVLAFVMMITLVPLGAFTALADPADQPAAEATTSATYYKKANWENRIKDKSRWKVEDSQTLVRVTTSDPIQMNDIDYDGMFIDANGRYVIRLVYKEKTQAASAVWHKALINFGDLEKFVDFDLSHVVGRDGTTQYKLENVNGIVGRSFDLPSAVGGRANQRKNLPINLVLKEGVDLKSLGNENFIIQMRLTTDDYSKVYAYAPGKSSMDYSTYTKTTGVSLADKVNSLFLKGGLQADSTNATNQEFFMSEFIANPKDYSDTSNLGIIRTQYMGQGTTIVRETVGGEPVAFTQVFDANLVKYLKADSKGYVGYVNVMTVARELSPYTKNVGIPEDKINYSSDKKLAYIVIGTSDFSKGDVKVVEVPKHDQYVKVSGFYITAIDYVVDKGEFENTFSDTHARKLNYSTMSGWTNPNNKGWTVFEKQYANDYVVPEGESYLIDTTSKPAGDQIMIHIGGDQAISRKPQGYYNGFVTGNGAVDTITKFAEGVYKFTLREGATIKAGQSLKIYMPYDSTFAGPVNFLETHNGSKLNEGAATLTLQNDRNINMHLYTDLPRGASFKLKYTLKDETEQKELVFTTPKVGTLWQYSNSNKVLTGVPNKSILSSGGNFWINTKKLEPGKDIIVEAYDNNGNKIDSKTSWFKYVNIDKIENTNKIAWTDHSDKSSILSINKSLYTPYQLLFTNDYADGTDDFYKDPRVLPASNDDFNKKDTKEFVGYTKYDGGKVRTLYEEGRVGKLYAKVEADENEYDKDGNLVGDDVRKDVTIKKADIFDAQFNEEEKTYKAYEYKVDLTKMLPYHSEDKTEKPLTLLKDMKFVSNASDGSSLPSDLYETRVRARVLFDTTEGAWTDDSKKAVKIAPDNVKFYGEDGYAANGFEGANVEANTGDKFPEAPTLAGKNFLGWVTEEGKKALGDKAVVTADEFNKLPKDQIFTNETPVTKHLVVYAVYSNEVTVTFDANQGTFTDGKDTTNVKVEGGNVTAPTPTRDGFTFKGWADKKDATKPTDGILDNVTAPKTVYAVWEKTEKTPLELTAPTPVEVKDLKGLTSDEIDKVKKAVVEANKDKGITEADVTVAEDGTVTVTKNGKTATLKPEQTVTQKVVQNEFNPPKEPVKVGKIGELTDDEIAEIKQAVIDANPDRNLKDDEITVDKDGNVSIKQGGKVGTIPAEKTVVQKDTILDLTAPDEKVEVKDPTNLTKAERDKVAAAVKAKNNLADGDKIEVDSKGNVKVTTADGKKTGTLEGKDTVKPFTRDGKKLNPPANKVKVGDTNKLTEAEKQAVRDAIKAANPVLDFKDEEIQVDSNGTVTVPMGDSDGSIPGTDTVEEAKEADKTIKLVAPEKVLVADKNKLDNDDKDAVKKAIKDANPTLNLQDSEIEVADDGSVTVTRGTGESQKVGQLSQADTVVEKLKKPEAKALSDGSVVVRPKDERTEELDITFGDAANPTTVTATKGADGKWKLADGTDPSITIDEATGLVTIPAKMLKNNDEVKAKAKAKAGELVSEEATVNSNDTTAPKAPTVEAKDDGSVKVTPPTDADTKEVSVTYTPTGATDPVTVTATKEDGKWKLPQDAPEGISIDENTGVITIPADKVADESDVKAKAKDNSNNESDEATAKTKKDTADTTAPGKPTISAEEDGSVKVTPPADADTKEVSVTYTPTGATKPVTVTATKEDGKWKLPQDAPEGITIDENTGVITIPADKVADESDVKAKAKDNSNNESDEATAKTKKDTADKIVAPAKPVEVKNPANLSKEEKDAVEKAVKDANPNLPEGSTIEVGNDGSVTVKDKDGKEIGKLTPAQTVKKAGTPTPQPDKKSQQPSVDSIYDSDDYVTGRGTPGATIVVRFPDGLTETTVVEYDGRWAVRVPYILYDGVRIYVTQIEKDMTESDPVSAEVRYDDEYWRERDRYNRYDRRDKEVKEVKEEKKPTQPSKVEPRWTPSALNAHDHFSYIKGYGENIFAPNRTITRAEVAMIFARLSLNKSTAGAPQFKDVKAGDWYKTAIDIIARQGVIKGYEDGTFRPNQPITRREFAAIAARYAGNIDAWKTFRDVPPTDWAYTLINRVAGAGWINGYEDGTFRPNNNITRAEVVAIVNRMLNRTADKAYVENNLMNSSNAFVDNMRSAWYYYDIYEAAFGHSYERMMNGVDEKWNRVNGQSFEVRER
ncbi:putative repeat protein (TIGR02543 family) [Ezakiella coagulans]|uniref:Putative repeat protein (TIGR02543 family) n=3 Tax=Tissierellia TaxID=1737404 RepID=A0A2U1DNE0_9FIRM|nr:S-layer homology domain-containing protein [Ezakiella coagulans]PVY89207.1 putative repeat protein (TIGR02543 family) [Ezakiella coagulans]